MTAKGSFSELFKEARQHDDYWSEGLVIEFTEELARLMEERKISRSALAEKIGHSPAYVTKVLRGNANFTVATMAKLARAVGSEVRIHLAPTGSRTTWYDQASARMDQEESGVRKEEELARAPLRKLG